MISILQAITKAMGAATLRQSEAMAEVARMQSGQLARAIETGFQGLAKQCQLQIGPLLKEGNIEQELERIKAQRIIIHQIGTLQVVSRQRHLTLG